MGAQYVSCKYRKFESTTNEQLLKEKEELHFLGKTYLCYLKSLSKCKKFNATCKAKPIAGSSVNVVTFKLAHDPKKIC